MRISLCMIVKNEEETLAHCLESAKNCVDEIVIADTGSTDRTVEIARNYTEKIFPFAWNDDFSAARNFAFSKATGDYLLWLDADDYLSPVAQTRLTLLKESLAAQLPDIVMCPYDVAFDSAGNAVCTFYRERILRREAGFIWAGRVHECITPRGKISYADIHVSHLGSHKIRGARNLRIYQKWAAEERLSGRDLFYYGRELYYNALYTEAIAVIREMLDGEGWYVNKIEACKILALCYKAKNDFTNALEACFRSFLYGEPRAAILCEIALIFRMKNNLREAVYWYESALLCKDHAAEGDFEDPTARTLVPLLELTCCYYSLGDPERAVYCHKKAEEQFENHPSVKYNRLFFKSKSLL